MVAESVDLGARLLSVPLTGCVALGEWLYLSVPPCPHLQMGIIVVPGAEHCHED